MEMTTLQVGTIIGERYRVLGKLGSGGMGDVYAAEDLKLQDKLRAIKVTDSIRASEEARMLMRLSHPSLPHIIDSFSLEGIGMEAIVMDYIHGLTLGELFVRQGKKLSFREVLRMAVPLCSALVYLHRQSPPIIHRDIKPSNIMVEDNGHVRLIDFGIAKSRAAAQTQTTMKLGTPGFAAPEQHLGRSEIRTDIYGFGAMLYYLLSEGSYIQPAEHLNRRSSFLKALQSDVPGPFAEMLWRMVQPSTDARYAAMADVERELKAFAPNQGNLDAMWTYRSEYPANEKIRGYSDSKMVQISVVALSPGAGATFIAISLAKLLAVKGLKVSAAEFPAERPEWRALLRSNMRGRGEGKYVSWDENGVSWHALRHPVTMDQREELDKLRLRLGGGNSAVSITDMSGGSASLREDHLLQSDIVLVAADPYPSKWTADQLQELRKISDQLASNGGTMIWIANKDTRFMGRSEWIRMLPHPPLAAIPLLPAGDFLDAIWRGKWATDIKGLSKQLERGFQPLIEYIVHKIQKAHVSFRR